MNWYVLLAWALRSHMIVVECYLSQTLISTATYIYMLESRWVFRQEEWQSWLVSYGLGAHIPTVPIQSQQILNRRSLVWRLFQRWWCGDGCNNMVAKWTAGSTNAATATSLSSQQTPKCGSTAKIALWIDMCCWNEPWGENKPMGSHLAVSSHLPYNIYIYIHTACNIRPNS